jgi:hypothetical protein
MEYAMDRFFYLQYGMCNKGLISFKKRLQHWKKLEFFGEQSRCFPQNLFSDGRFVLINIPLM